LLVKAKDKFADDKLLNF